MILDEYILCCRESTGIPFNQPCTADVKRELITLSLPAIAGQAIDPLAQLMETAYIGRLGIYLFVIIYLIGFTFSAFYVFDFFVPVIFFHCPALRLI